MDLWTANDNYLKSITQEKVNTAQNVSTFQNAKHDPEPTDPKPAEPKPTEPAEPTGGNE